jgi:hypothetical protein
MAFPCLQLFPVVYALYLRGSVAKQDSMAHNSATKAPTLIAIAPEEFVDEQVPSVSSA